MRDEILGKYDLKASTATVPDETKEGEGEGDGEEAGAAYISASAAIVVLGAMLQ